MDVDYEENKGFNHGATIQISMNGKIQIERSMVYNRGASYIDRGYLFNRSASTASVRPVAVRGSGL